VSAIGLNELEGVAEEDEDEIKVTDDAVEEGRGRALPDDEVASEAEVGVGCDCCSALLCRVLNSGSE